MNQSSGKRIEMEVDPPSTLTPERLLLLAILAQAMKDLKSGDDAAARNAAEWVASSACDQFCELLGYSAEPVRRFVARHRGLP